MARDAFVGPVDEQRQPTSVSDVRKKPIVIILAILLVVVPVMLVGDQAVRTLRTLTIVERERDTWQRPDDILRALNLSPGMTVVDLGSGAGYFSLKIAPRVAPAGRVLAVDLRRESLAFLWIRAVLGGHANLHVIRNQVDDPKLPPGPIDAVLIANTYHELTAPQPDSERSVRVDALRRQAGRRRSRPAGQRPRARGRGRASRDHPGGGRT